MALLPLLLALALIFLGFSTMTLIRNEKVFAERMRVLNIVADRARKMSREDENADWRSEFARFDKYTYNEMVYKFWIPVSKFYEDVV